MTQKFKQTWMADLRSGRYKQGKKYLYDPVDKTYCCIGVAGITAGVSKTYMRGLRVFHNPVVPKELVGMAGWNNLVRELTYMNDKGKTFEEIADYIELNVKTETRVLEEVN